MSALLISRPEHNLEFQQRLYDLRSETKDAFDEAKRLEARWKELEKEQREVYQVSPQILCFSSLFIYHSDLPRNSFCYVCVTAQRHRTKHLRSWLRLSFGESRSNSLKGSLEYLGLDKISTSLSKISKNRGRYTIRGHCGQKSGPMGKSSGEITEH